MKKYIIFSLSLLFAITLLTGCCREHQWANATCDAPKTCTECGKTEGENLEHIWVDATCSAPKTCSLCGATEGESLPHTEGTPANYQSGAICLVCGAEMGEKLPADFESMNVEGSFVELNQTVPYLTCCYEDTSSPTVGKATAIEYERFDSDDNHEPRDGFEWIKFTWELTYDDQNANDSGFMTGQCFDDYYTIMLHDDSTVIIDEEKNIFTNTVNYNGQEYTDCITECGLWNWGDGWVDSGNELSSITGQCTSYIQIPIGYDGVVLGLRNRAIDWNGEEYINDVANSDTVFFRCK